MSFDFAIVGAGIAGSCTAYELKKRGFKVVVYDKGERFCASLAAGAFISPMIGKPNPFKELTNRAFVYSTKLYQKILDTHYIQKGVLRLPKNEQDEEKFKEYEKYIEFEFIKKNGGFFFPQAGIARANILIPKLLKDIPVFYQNISSLEKIDAKNIVLATGVFDSLYNLPYKITRGVWGERITIKSDTVLEHAYHKNVSISPTIEGNKILIGATHKREHKRKIDKNAKIELIQKAKEIIEINIKEVLEIKAGMRGASMDYFPVVGNLINAKASIKKYPGIAKGQKIPIDKLVFYKNIFLHTGFGGRGFVLAPYMAKKLVDFIVDKKSLESNIESSRFFYRWARRI